MAFRKARPEELGNVLALYKSVVGTEFCVWNEFYPDMTEVRGDYEAGGLYVMTANAQITGVCSVVPENELDGFGFWTVSGGAREIARVAVASAHRGRGISLTMVNALAELLAKQGCTAIHLSVSAVNIPAIKTYYKAGFVKVGEADLYDNGHYYLLEKKL